MSEKIVIVDYGAGNLKSAQNATQRAACELDGEFDVLVSSDPIDVKNADRVILPGVGAFADCMNGLAAVEGMVDALHQRVILDAVPFLGICVGMQLLASEGREKVYTNGLDWIPGVVKHIEPDDKSLKVPHMGWNTLTQTNPHLMLDNLDIGPGGLNAYFVHSYHFEVADPAQLLATTEYGQKLTAIVGRDNLIATQFHPEKSQALGLKFISNFLNWSL
ncbi:imidazole glycerol phosphate synthase subunit HisH [Maritalea sp.]|jgi:glutamine amidotransferase|uniref:imidazole glycerol phosphate synthase subunit HisH n=1 Tax=Maritalea sp. TaxID=2003361 RepID=UPI0039E550D2